MALYIGQAPQRRQTAGEAFAGGLAQGLTNLAPSLFEQHIKNSDRKRQAGLLEKQGLTPNEANFLATLPPQQQFEALQTLWAQKGQQEVPQANPMGGMQQLMQPEQAQVQPGSSSPWSSQIAAQQRSGMQQLNPQQEINALQQPMAPQVQQQQPRPMGLAQAYAQGGPKAQEFKLKKQTQIDKENAPYLKRFDEGVDINTKIRDIALEMEKLLETGQVRSGFIKGKLPANLLSSTETQQFDTLSNEMASLLSRGSGPQTGFKIKFAQSMKPNLSQDTKTQKALVAKLIDRAHTNLQDDAIRQDLIEKNGGFAPANLKGEIEKYKKSIPDFEPGTNEGDLVYKNGQFWRRQNNYILKANATDPDVIAFKAQLAQKGQ